MDNTIKQRILNLCSKHGIDKLDIKTIENLAIRMKMFDVVVYLNNNVHDYLSFAKNNGDYKDCS